MSLLIFIEGNIGAGKTTLLRKLKTIYDNTKGLVLTEPVANWPSLKLFYEDKRKYAYQLQCEVLDSFHDREVNCPTRQFYILERSLRSAFDVFGHLNCTEDERALLREKVSRMGRENNFSFQRSVYIYVRTPAEKCHRNIGIRDKAVDSLIDIDYLRLLEKRHDEVFMGPGSTTIVLDGTKNSEDLARDAFDTIEKLLATQRID